MDVEYFSLEAQKRLGIAFNSYANRCGKMNINLILVFIAFAISQSLVGQHGHLWNDLEIEKNRQYEGYIVDLS